MPLPEAPSMARRRSHGEVDEAKRAAFVKELVRRTDWLKSRDGRAELDDKGSDDTSVAYGMIQSVLEIGHEAGMNPLQLVHMALRGYYATQSHSNPEIVEVLTHIDDVLDRADAGAEAR